MGDRRRRSNICLTKVEKEITECGRNIVSENFSGKNPQIQEAQLRKIWKKKERNKLWPITMNLQTTKAKRSLKTSWKKKKTDYL